MSSVLPTTISVRGGQPVTIIGTGFREGLRVLFDGIPARAVRVDGSRFLLATTPRHAAGPVEVMVADDQSLVRLGGTSHMPARLFLMTGCSCSSCWRERLAG